ncbi:MAG: alkaline phosphatase [Porphyromonas sp.]|nr:alkaline phosphatase [Porphyromonas sp.]
MIQKQKLSKSMILGLLLLLAPLSQVVTAVEPAKNVIIMISDGTSLSSVSLARWYQRALDAEKQTLHFDPYISGTVLTYCSNAPIGDSAPTTSTYMNGVPSIQGFVGTHPYSSGEADLVPLDASMEYRPLVSLMEATKLLQERKTGIVVTCEFPHATPADATAHSYNRGRYEWIIPQMVHNGVDVVIGGGAGLLNEKHQDYLRRNGYGVFLNDISSLSDYQGGKIWSLFADRALPYDIDADHSETPTLAQMTETAIRTLNKGDQGDNGFFLLVEGSLVDWAAHGNDPVGIATEFLAFNEAVGVALDFAKEDGNTVVIVTSDHGNSGISIGSRRSPNYAGTSLSEVFGPLTTIKKTAPGLAALLVETPGENVAEVFETNASFAPTEEELKALQLLRKHSLASRDSKERQEILDEVKTLALENLDYNTQKPGNLTDLVTSIYRSRMFIEFTTSGHTGEEVFLATYAPKQEQRMMGFNTNIQLHDYMRGLLGLEPTMIELTHKWFAPHTEVFAGMDVTITGDKAVEKILNVRYNGHTFTIPAFSKVGTLDGKPYMLPLATVYVDKKDVFYLPASVREALQK